MRIYEFENYIQKGLGRAILLLRKEPDKTPFRDAVWKHAIHDPRYDSQCNNARGFYIKMLFDCFDDSDALLSDLLCVYGEGSGDPEDRCYYIKNLEEMIEEHVEGADAALDALYHTLMEELMTYPNTLTDGRDREREDYFLAASTRYRLNHDVLCDLVRDGVTLLQRSKRYNITDFTYFFNEQIRVSKAEEFTNILASLEKDDPDSKAIFESYLKETDAFQQRREPANETIPAPTNWREAVDFAVKKEKPLIPVKKSLWQNLSKEDRAEISRLVEDEPDPIRRTILISQLSRYGTEVLQSYPRDPSPLIAELESNAHVTYPFSYEKLLIRELSHVVAQIKHPAVRDAAIRQLSCYMENPDSIAYSTLVEAWMTNYQPDDANALEAFVTSITDIDVLHAVGMDLLGNDQLIPESILVYIYENTPCSNCRNRFLTALLVRYGSTLNLPEHISALREEAKLDCDYGTRTIARAQSIKRKFP